MESEKTVRRTYFNAVYRHNLDPKRRLQIPAKWRPTEEGVELTIVLWPKETAGPCLRVMPPEKMASLMKDLDAMPNSDPNKGVLKRFIGSQSEQVTLDQAGRICLPEDMARAADIKGQVVLVGRLDQFEIWNPERYEQVRASDTIMAHEAFKMME